MMQTLFIRTDNEKAIEALKALAHELGLQLSPYEDDEDEDDAGDIAVARERRHDERVPLEEVLKNLNINLAK